MVTKELIKAEIDKVKDEYLQVLYKIVKDLEEPEEGKDSQSLMSKLKGVKIEGPKDFAKNIDLYLTGEKNVE